MFGDKKGRGRDTVDQKAGFNQFADHEEQEEDDEEEEDVIEKPVKKKGKKQKIKITSTKQLADFDLKKLAKEEEEDDDDDEIAYSRMQDEMEKDDLESELKKDFPSFEQEFFGEDAQKLKKKKGETASRKKAKKADASDLLIDERRVIKPIEDMQDIYKDVNNYLTVELGMSQRRLMKVEQMTHIYAFSVDTLKAKVEVLCKYLSASKVEIGFMLYRFPKLFGYSAATLEERLLFWKDMSAWMQHIKSEPSVLSYSLASIQKKEEQFAALGISATRPLLRAKPDLITYKVETVHNKISRLAESMDMELEDMVDWVTEMPVVLKYQAACSARTLKWLLGHGFTTSEAAHQVRSFPDVLSVKFKRFKKNWRFLQQNGCTKTQAKQFTMRANRINNIRIYSKSLLMRYIQRELGMDPLKVTMEYPKIYTYSLERTIAPRVYFLRERYYKIRNMKLDSVFSPEDEIFAKRVARYPYMEYKDMLERQWSERLWPQLMQNLANE